MNKPMVLVVDDDELLSEMLKLTLEVEGFAAVTAPNGAEGLARLDEQRVDCVLLDLVMPKMDGVKFLRVLADRGGPRPPVIVISASAGEQLDDQLRALGVVGIARKPLAPDDIIARVRAALETQGF